MTSAALPEEASSPLAPGVRLDRYELLGPIAEGGMASVWVARQRGKHGFEKLVAIKTILPKFASDPRFQKMFLDEARIASRLEHTNVAQILDLGEENEVLYLAMEYVEGEALSKLVKACLRLGIALPTPIALRVLADACAGLHEAHELCDPQGRSLEIVHRDVSPHNILVSTRGVAKLIDFGIAKARSRVSSDTNIGVLKGKLQYMAPEQALGRTVDRRADVWAVGAVLYQVLAGRAPYQAEGQLAALALLGSGRPPAPLPPAVPGPIAGLVRKALAFAPDKRYPSAAALREAIECVMAQTGMAATSVDVAAFVMQHLSDQIERKKRAVDELLAEAAERSRARGLSEAKVEAVLQAAASRAPHASSGAVPGRGVQPSEFAPPSGSYATLSSAAFDADSGTLLRPSRWPLLVVAGGAAAAMALVGLGMAGRPRGPANASAAPQLAALPQASPEAAVPVEGPSDVAPSGDVPASSPPPAVAMQPPPPPAKRPSRARAPVRLAPQSPAPSPGASSVEAPGPEPSTPPVASGSPTSSAAVSPAEETPNSHTVDDGF